MARPYFFNQGGSDAQVDNSVLGVNGVRAGTVVYAPEKFGNGVSGATFANKAVFANGCTSTQSGIITWNWKPTYADTEAADHHDIIYVSTPPGYAERLVVYWDKNITGVKVYTWEGAFTSNYEFQPSFSANDIIQCMLRYDSAAGAGDRFRMWFDGSELDQSVINNDGAWTYGSPIDILMIGGLNGASTSAVIGTLKFYADTSDATINQLIAQAGQERCGLNDVIT